MHDGQQPDDGALYRRLRRRCPLRGEHLPLLHLPSPDEDHDRDRLPGQHYVAGCYSFRKSYSKATQTRLYGELMRRLSSQAAAAGLVIGHKAVMHTVRRSGAFVNLLVCCVAAAYTHKVSAALPKAT
jgi:hypothetical protein